MKSLTEKLVVLGIFVIVFALASPAFSQPPAGGAAGEPGSGCDASGTYVYTGNAWRGMVTLSRDAGTSDIAVLMDGTLKKDQNCDCSGDIVNAQWGIANEAEWSAIAPSNLRGTCLTEVVGSFPGAPCRDSVNFELVGVGTITTSADNTTKTFEALIREFGAP